MVRFRERPILTGGTENFGWIFVMALLNMCSAPVRTVGIRGSGPNPFGLK